MPCGGYGEKYAALYQVSQCNISFCNGPSPIDCVYGDWMDWNACGKCGGQRKRFRHIVVHARNGGINCEKFASEELGPCPFYCEEQEHGHCVWGDWGPFGPCTARCGNGKKMRTRTLLFSAKENKKRSPLTTEWLNVHKLTNEFVAAETLRKRNPNDMLSAFGFGFFFVGALVAGFRLFARSRALAAREPVWCACSTQEIAQGLPSDV